MVSSSFVAKMMTDKYLKHMPLYRQGKLFKNVGLAISRQNLSNWFLAGTKELEPITLMSMNTLFMYLIHCQL